MDNSEKHYFPGSNTSEGFYSLFQYILPIKEAKKIFYIKGGPGTGKSSCMKKIGQLFKDKGYNIEYFHCSSDNESLDALVIKELKVELLDGTAPHINDPKCPGAVGEILDFGTSLNKEGLSIEKNNILNTNKDISNTFKRSYRYLESARSIIKDWTECNKNSLNMNKLILLKNDLNSKIFNKIGHINEYKEPRHLFATAFTPNGIISYIENIIEDIDNVYVLKGDPGSGKNDTLNFLKDQCLMNGLYVEVYHDPFIPSRIEHIVIPKLNTAILSSNEINKDYVFKYSNVIDMNALISPSSLYKSYLKEDIPVFYSLIDKALKNLTNCKKLHDKLESYYINNIDFNVVNDLCNSVIRRLENY